MVLILCIGLAVARPLAAETLNFCWTGANGYTMTGRMTLSDAAMRKPIVTQGDVSAFKIAGYRNGALLGTWNAQDAGPETTWHLRFDPATMTFPTGGSFTGPRSQGWNANGEVTDCGLGGFGFNSGNYGQDICVNGAYISASTIDPATPFVATRAPVTPECDSVAPIS
ncbi:hypothetical protein EU805_12390 [Salipiger sp. IMCC34102]|nr:hypothetical protein EU805_12390 [Salipiger sp. IMCC34102]